MNHYQEHLDHIADLYHGNMDGGVEELLACLRWEAQEGTVHLRQWYVTDWDIVVENPFYYGPKSPNPYDGFGDEFDWVGHNQAVAEYEESEALWKIHLAEV